MSSTEWYHKFRERIKAERRARYLSDAAFREDTKRRAREYRINNLAAVNAKKAEYRKRKREELTAKENIRYHRKKNDPEFAKKRAEARASKRQEHRAYSRQRAATISESYVREQLSKYSPLSTHEWPVEIVETKKLQLQAKRELRKQQTNGR